MGEELDSKRYQTSNESGKTALGVELGSTRIREDLIGEDHLRIAREP